MVSPSPGLPPAAAHQSGEPLSFWRGWALPLPACSSGSPPAEPRKLDSCQSPPHSHQQAPPRRPDAGCTSGRRAVRLADSRQLHSSALAVAGRQPAGRQVRQLLDGGRTGHPCQAPRQHPKRAEGVVQIRQGPTCSFRGSMTAANMREIWLATLSCCSASCAAAAPWCWAACAACRAHSLRVYMFCVRSCSACFCGLGHVVPAF